VPCFAKLIFLSDFGPGKGRAVEKNTFYFPVNSETRKTAENFNIFLETDLMVKIKSGGCERHTTERIGCQAM